MPTKTDPRESLAAWVKEQESFTMAAALLGISTSWLRNIITGQADPSGMELLRRMKDKFGTSADDWLEATRG